MGKLPDVIGLPLNEAKNICTKEGYIVEVLTTGSFKGAYPEDLLRVVRFKASKDKMVLTVVLEKMNERRWM